MDTTTIAQITHYVGIDISKAKLDCWLRPAAEHLCCENDAEGFSRLDQWLSAQGCSPGDTIICTEDTGLYGKRLLMALTQAGWSVAVEKTTILDNVAPDHHRKDDKFDARLLAEYADRFSDRLRPVEPPEEALERMSQLYSERRRLVRQRTATKTKQTQAAQQPCCPELLRETWDEQLQLLDQHIQQLAARSASTHYDRFNHYKQRKLEEGKPWPVVGNNIVNKLITISCAIWNSGEFYDPDHTSRFDREKKAA